MSILGAFLRDETEALFMHFFNVVPPFWLVTDLLKALVKARLAEILMYDILTLNPIEVILNMVWRAVLTITETLFSLERFRASRACPSNKSRLDQDIILQPVSISVKFFDEIECSLTAGAVPELYLGHITGTFDGELGQKCRAFLLLCKLDQSLTICFTDEHRWNTNASASTIVSHDDIGDILNSAVDNY